MRLLLFIVALGLIGSLVGQSRLSLAPANEEAARQTPVVLVSAPGTQGSADDRFARMDGAVELERAADGHFYADVEINGATVRMLVDTGASAIALSREDALAARVPTSIGMNEVIGRGASGDVHGEFVTLERVELGPLEARDLAAVVLNSGEQSLLGQSFLSKFASVQIEGDRMVLR